MKTALLYVCALTLHAATFCPPGPGTWCEQPVGPDAGQYISKAQYTLGSGSLNSIWGAINGLGGADMFIVNIPDPAAFAASYAAASGTATNGANVIGDSQASLYLFNASGMGIEAGTALTGFTGAGGLYFIDITGDGNLPEYGPAGNRLPIFSGSLPVNGAGALSGYSGAGCGAACAGGYDISLTGAQYSGAPEPGTLALAGLGLLAISSSTFRTRVCGAIPAAPRDHQ